MKKYWITQIDSIQYKCTDSTKNRVTIRQFKGIKLNKKGKLKEK